MARREVDQAGLASQWQPQNDAHQLDLGRLNFSQARWMEGGCLWQTDPTI